MKLGSYFLSFIPLTFLLYYLVIFSSFPASALPAAQDSLRNQQAEKFIEQAEKQLMHSPRNALNNAQKAIGVIQMDEHSRHLLSGAYYQTAHAYFLLGKIDSSVIWFNKLLLLPDVDDVTKAKSFDFLSIDYRKLGNFERSHHASSEAMKLYQSLNDSAGIIETLINEARVYSSSGNRKKAMQLYFDALKFTEQAKDTLKTGRLYGWIANVYMDIDEDEKGKIYYRKAIQKLAPYRNTYFYADILNNYGIVFYDEQLYDSALFYYSEALDIYKSTGQSDAIAVGYQNIGITYVFLGRADEGIGYLFRSLNSFEALNLLRDQASVFIDLGRAYLEMNRFDSSDYYLQKALKISKAVKHAFYTKDALLLLYKMNNKAGRFEKALSAYKNYVAFKDSIDNQAMKENFQELEVKYQTARREKEILQLKDRELLDKADKKILTLGIVGLLLLFILVMTLILMRRKKDMQIHRQKVLVHQKEKALAKAELARHEAHEKQLENEIEYKTKQLTTHAMNMMQKNKLLHDITEDIENRMKSSECKSRETMNQVKRSLKQGLNVDKDWDLFKLYFEQTNERFFDKLKKMNPNLTGNDYKLCALIKLNMSVKEMASVMNISADSLKNARYRLKKKLKLQADDKLNIFIGNI